MKHISPTHLAYLAENGSSFHMYNICSVLPDQELLLGGAGITVEDLRRVSRWHGRMVNPKVARATAAELVAHTMARKKKLYKSEKAGKASSSCTPKVTCR